MASRSVRWLEVFSDGLLVSLEPANGWLVCKMAGRVFRWFASVSGTSRWLAGLSDGWKSFPMVCWCLLNQRMAGRSVRWQEEFSDGLLVSLEPANGWLVFQMAGRVFQWFASVSGTSKWFAGLSDGWKSFPMVC